MKIRDLIWVINLWSQNAGQLCLGVVFSFIVVLLQYIYTDEAIIDFNTVYEVLA